MATLKPHPERRERDAVKLRRLWLAFCNGGDICVEATLEGERVIVPQELWRTVGRYTPDTETLQGLPAGAVYTNPRLVAAGIPDAPKPSRPRPAAEAPLGTEDPDTAYQARLNAFRTEHRRYPNRKEDRAWGQNRKPKTTYKQLDELRERHLSQELREGGRGANRIK